jgi:hypothetical protein
VSWSGQPAAASVTPAGAEPSFSPASPGGPAGGAPAEACPLCGSPLQGDQDWCLSCGGAAHTRLSATPNWKAPMAVAIVVAALLLGVLAAALVKLAHGPGPAPPAITTVVTAPAASGTPATPGATTPATTTPGTTTPGTTTPGTTTPGTTTPGATTPRSTTPTTPGAGSTAPGGRTTTTPGAATTNSPASGAASPAR